MLSGVVTEYRYSEWHWWYLQCFDAVGWVAGRASGLQRTEWWGAGVSICLERDADLHMAQLMPLPLTVSCFSKIQIGFTFLVPADPGSPGKWAVKRVCVCVCVWVTWCVVYKSQCNCWFNDGVSAIEVGAALTAEWNHWANILQVIQVCTHKHRVTHRQYHTNTTV